MHYFFLQPYTVRFKNFRDGQSRKSRKFLALFFQKTKVFNTKVFEPHCSMFQVEPNHLLSAELFSVIAKVKFFGHLRLNLSRLFLASLRFNLSNSTIDAEQNIIEFMLQSVVVNFISQIFDKPTSVSLAAVRPVTL